MSAKTLILSAIALVAVVNALCNVSIDATDSGFEPGVAYVNVGGWVCFKHLASYSTGVTQVTSPWGNAKSAGGFSSEQGVDFYRHQFNEEGDFHYQATYEGQKYWGTIVVETNVSAGTPYPLAGSPAPGPSGGHNHTHTPEGAPPTPSPSGASGLLSSVLVVALVTLLAL